MAQAKVVTGGKVRYAVVGVGWIAQSALLPGVEHTGNSKLAALVTDHHRKAEVVGEEYGVDKIYSYDELPGLLTSGEIDAVYLSTPNFDHTYYAVQVLKAGIHLLLEKPMATSVADCQEMMAAAESTGAKFMIAYRLHFEPGTLKALERVREGEIGTVRFFNSSFSQKIARENHRAKHGYWAGPVPDMGTYPINAVRNIFGAEPIEVFATGVCTDPAHFRDEEGKPFDDTVSVTLKFEGERLGAFTLAYDGGNVDDYRIVGSKGSLMSDPAYQVNKALKQKLVVGAKDDTSEESFKQTDHFGSELKYFSDCILNDKSPEPDGEEGMLDVRVLVAIEQALATGQVQKLAPYHRSKRPNVKQGVSLDAVKEPELIAAHKPSEGQ